MPQFRARFRLFAAQIAAVAVSSCLVAVLHAQTLLNTRTLAGSANDVPAAIATDSAGNLYVAGSTTSPDFPVTNALFAQLPEPALRVSPDGHTFTALPLPVQQVTSVAASPNGQILLAATNAGIYRSADSGATWASVHVSALAVAFDPAGNAYAVSVGTPVSLIGAVVTGWNFWISHDAGLTWQTPASFSYPTSGANPVSRIFFDPSNPSIIYAFINFGLMRSTDGGTTWQTITIPATGTNAPGGQTPPTAFVFAPSQPGIAYATTFYTPLVKSTDGGNSWQAEAQISSAGEYAMAVDPQNAATVWLVNGAGIQKSTDGGATFQQVFAGGDGSWQSIAVSDTDSTHIFASDKHNVYASFDGGATWTIVASGQISAVFAMAGKVYIAGSVSPTVFLTKLDPTLSQILYSTFIGPGTVTGIAVDSAGSAYLAGTTQSHSFPITSGAVGGAFTSTTAGFVAKLRADDAALVYSTVLDAIEPNGIAVDSSGDAVIAGPATAGAVPVTKGAFEITAPSNCNAPVVVGGVSQISSHAFAAELNPAASAWLYATYISGACGDIANDVALDSTGAAWVGGETYAQDFPTTPDAMPVSTAAPFSAGFLSHLGPAGDKLLYSTFLANATPAALAVNPQGAMIAAGYGSPQPTPGAYQSQVGGCPPVFSIGPPIASGGAHGFVLQLAPGATSPGFVSAIGGACVDDIYHAALDSSGDIWVTGSTESTNFPSVIPLPDLGTNCCQVGFIAALDPTGSSLLTSGITAIAGVVAAGPNGFVYFAEPELGAAKNANSVLLARINALQQPAIDLDSITYFGPPRPLAQGYVGFSVAPGQAVRLIGRGIGPAQEADATSTPSQVLPTLVGIQVTFNGIPAELATVQANQIVCFAPFELAGATTATVQVTYQGQTSNPYTLPVVPQNIDVYSVLNPDGTPNSASNPAPVNSVVALFLTGAGQTAPPSINGALNLPPLPVPAITPSITVNGSAEQPTYFGAAPAQVAGVTQLNLFVPDPGPGGTADAANIGGDLVTIYARRANM